MTDKKYIFFIDIDGTLVPAGGTKMTDSLVQEILRLKQLGHIFVVSTGRALASALSVEGIEIFDYISVLLGSCIYKMPEKKLIEKSQGLNKKEVEDLTNYLNKNNIEWSYKTETTEKSIFSDSEFYTHKNDCEIVQREQFVRDLSSGNIMQMLIASHIEKSVMDKFPSFSFFLMPNNYIDLTRKNFSKAKCVEYFRKIFPSYTFVSMGDSVNDAEMFEAADISIAMGNSEEKIKKMTTFITKNVDEDGLVYAYRNILKI